ncbi:MAG: RHS repeat-associated core domain-containing protein, partial [Planctomycetota bacterium]
TMNPADGSFARSFAEGHVSYFTPQGRVVAAHDSFGAVTTFGYAGNLLTSVTSPTGFVFTLAYQSGRLASITDSAGRTTLFQVNAAGNLISTTDTEGTPHTFAYDADHLMVSQTGPRGERSEYDYSNGRVVAARSFDTDGTTILRERFYSPSVLRGEAGAAIAAGQGTILNPIPVVPDNTDIVIDGRGVVHEHEIDGFGNTIRVEDGFGQTSFTFDDLRRMTSRTRPNGWRSEYSYDAAGHVIQVRDRNPSGVLYATTSLEYNGTGGRLSREVDAEGKQRTFDYDTLGRLIRTTDALGDEIVFWYENPLHPSLPTRLDREGVSVTMAYDAHGNMLTVTDPLGHVTAYNHNTATGMLQSVTTPESHTVALAYDLMNRVASITGGADGDLAFSYTDLSCACEIEQVVTVSLDAGGQLTHQYDGLGRLLAQTDPLGLTELFFYDAEDGLIEHRNRAMQTTLYTLDGAGRVIAKSDSAGGVELFEFDALGALSYAQNSQVTVSFTNDFLGRPTTAETTIDYSGGTIVTPPITRQVSYTYNRTGDRLTMTDAFGTQSYQYDDLHRLVGSTDAFGQAYTFGHDSLGRRSAITRANGVITQFSYDAASQLTQVAHQSSVLVTLLADLYTLYDDDGALATSSVLTNGVAVNWSFLYDARQRLDAATSSVAFGDAQVSVAATYDAANRVIADSTFTYTHDLDGRMTSRTRTASGVTDVFEYNIDGRINALRQTRIVSGSPVVMLDVEYIYDALGRRTAKVVNGVRSAYIYDGSRITEELDPRGVARRVYVHGLADDEPLAVVDLVTDEKYYYHQDRLGNVRGLTNSTGALVQAYQYDSFGAMVTELVPALYQPFGFLGRERDRESGLYSLRARYYAPELGRFTSEDPLDLEGSDNFYAYGHNDPVNRSDPSGEQSFKISKLRLGTGWDLTLIKIPKPRPPLIPWKPKYPPVKTPPWKGCWSIRACGGGSTCKELGLGLGFQKEEARRPCVFKLAN